MSAHGENRRLRLLMQRCRDEIKIVEDLISSGHCRVAVSRSYYAVFYAATAILANLGKEFSKHSALLSAFGKEYGKKDEEGKKMHRIFLDLFDIRNDADYKLSVVPTEEESRKYQRMALDFYEWAKKQLPGID